MKTRCHFLHLGLVRIWDVAMMEAKNMELEIIKIRGRSVNMIQETKIKMVRVSFQSYDHSDDWQFKSLLHNYL